MTTFCQADVLAIFAAKTVRTFCYGFLGIVLPVYLSDLGLSAAGLGVAVTLTLAGSAGPPRVGPPPAQRGRARAAPPRPGAPSRGPARALAPSRCARGTRLVRGWVRAPVAGRLLFPRALRARPRGARLRLLRHAGPHGRVAPARSPGRRALRAPRDDGGFAPGVQRGADPDRVRAHGLGRDRAPLRAPAPPADGRADPAGVPDGDRRGPRAGGGGDHHERRPHGRPRGHAGAHGA